MKWKWVIEPAVKTVSKTTTVYKIPSPVGAKHQNTGWSPGAATDYTNPSDV